MNKPKKTVLTVAVLACGMLLGAAPAAAGDDRWERREHREWRDDDRGRHEHRHWREDRRDHKWHRARSHHYHYAPPVVIKERVIVHKRPRREVYHYYEAPPAYGYYGRDPAVVIGVNIPPIVIPLR